MMSKELLRPIAIATTFVFIMFVVTLLIVTIANAQLSEEEQMENRMQWFGNTAKNMQNGSVPVDGEYLDPETNLGCLLNGYDISNQ